MRSESLHDGRRRALLRHLAALGLAAGGGVVAASSRTAALRVGAPAPAATLVTLDGNHIATSDLIGRVVLLTFWGFNLLSGIHNP